MRRRVLASCFAGASLSLLGSTDPADAATEGSAPVPLKISRAVPPSIGLPYIRIRGAYPRVSGAAAPTAIRAVNARLRELVVADERGFRAAAVTNTSLPLKARMSNPGLYETAIDSKLVSASTAVVSVLLPVTVSQPLGATLEYWLSLTLRLPTGTSVHLEDMLANRSSGFRAIARAAREELIATNSCVREDERDSAKRAIYRQGWLPLAKNFQTFALVTQGIRIGFLMGDVAGIPCGSMEALVPYQTILPYMNEFGRRLVSGVRTANMK